MCTGFSLHICRRIYLSIFHVHFRSHSELFWVYRFVRDTTTKHVGFSGCSIYSITSKVCGMIHSSFIMYTTSRMVDHNSIVFGTCSTKFGGPHWTLRTLRLFFCCFAVQKNSFPAHWMVIVSLGIHRKHIRSLCEKGSHSVPFRNVHKDFPMIFVETYIHMRSHCSIGAITYRTIWIRPKHMQCTFNVWIVQYNNAENNIKRMRFQMSSYRNCVDRISQRERKSTFIWKRTFAK